MKNITLTLSLLANLALSGLIIDSASANTDAYREVGFQAQSLDLATKALNECWVGKSADIVRQFGVNVESNDVIYKDYTDDQGIIKIGDFTFRIESDHVGSISLDRI